LWTRPPTFEFVLNYSKARANSVLEPVSGHGRGSAKLFALVRLARPLHFRRFKHAWKSSFQKAHRSR